MPQTIRNLYHWTDSQTPCLVLRQPSSATFILGWLGSLLGFLGNLGFCGNFTFSNSAVSESRGGLRWYFSRLALVETSGEREGSGSGGTGKEVTSSGMVSWKSVAAVWGLAVDPTKLDPTLDTSIFQQTLNHELDHNTNICSGRILHATQSPEIGGDNELILSFVARNLKKRKGHTYSAIPYVWNHRLCFVNPMQISIKNLRCCMLKFVCVLYIHVITNPYSNPDARMFISIICCPTTSEVWQWSPPFQPPSLFLGVGRCTRGVGTHAHSFTQK